MVRVEKDYRFDGPDGPVTLAGLFGDCRQLLVQHIMFGPDWDAACPSCTQYTSEFDGSLIARLRSMAGGLGGTQRPRPDIRNTL